jgi:hypothetical protein
MISKKDGGGDLRRVNSSIPSIQTAAPCEAAVSKFDDFALLDLL